MQLQAALAAFQVQLAADGRSDHTKRQYARHVRALDAWLAKKRYTKNIAQLSPAVVAEFAASDDARMSAHGGVKKATTSNAMRTSLRCFLRWAHEAGYATANAARLLRRARCAPAPPRALRDDEQARLLEVLDGARGAEAERDRMLIHLLLTTGIRIGSALALDVEDVDLAHGELALRSTKGDRPTTALLPAATAKMLRGFFGKRETGPLFLAHGNRICMRHAQRRISNWFAAAGIQGKSAHSCRHYFACALLGKTGDLRLVQNALNHASIVSTTIYAQVDREKLRTAVGV
jgi:integrase/recombinase XerC